MNGVEIKTIQYKLEILLKNNKILFKIVLINKESVSQNKSCFEAPCFIISIIYKVGDMRNEESI